MFYVLTMNNNDKINMKKKNYWCTKNNLNNLQTLIKTESFDKYNNIFINETHKKNGKL